MTKPLLVARSPKAISIGIFYVFNMSNIQNMALVLIFNILGIMKGVRFFNGVGFKIDLLVKSFFRTPKSTNDIPDRHLAT